MGRNDGGLHNLIFQFFHCFNYAKMRRKTCKYHGWTGRVWCPDQCHHLVNQEWIIFFVIQKNKDSSRSLNSLGPPTAHRFHLISGECMLFPQCNYAAYRSGTFDSFVADHLFQNIPNTIESPQHNKKLYEKLLQLTLCRSEIRRSQ